MDNTQLKSSIERIHRVKDEIEALNSDLKEIYAEAVSNGYDRKALVKLISIMREDRDKLNDFESVLHTYRIAVGV